MQSRSTAIFAAVTLAQPVGFVTRAKPPRTVCRQIPDGQSNTNHYTLYQEIAPKSGRSRVMCRYHRALTPTAACFA